jgi:hypothetical protein
MADKIRYQGGAKSSVPALFGPSLIVNPMLRCGEQTKSSTRILMSDGMGAIRDVGPLTPWGGVLFVC